MSGFQFKANGGFGKMLMEAVSIKKATTADRKKGESYVVYDIHAKKIVTFQNTRCAGLKRDSAKEIAATDSNWKVASSEWAHDNDIR
jgi:hypothetical protein